MDGQIFISYRREESRWVARSLHSRLCRDFDQEKMFIDVDTVPLGDDFVKVIETTVPKCDILIAIIGPNWVSARDGEGVRKIDKAHDFMRLEIVTAFEAGIWVVPVLVDGATMPGPDDLPESLKPLARRNSLPITETSFVGDCNRLVSEIQRVLEQAAADKKIEEEIRLGKRARYYLREQREQEEREKVQRIMDNLTYGKDTDRAIIVWEGCLASGGTLMWVILSLISGKLDQCLWALAFGVAIVLFQYWRWRSR